MEGRGNGKEETEKAEGKVIGLGPQAASFPSSPPSLPFPPTQKAQRNQLCLPVWHFLLPNLLSTKKKKKKKKSVLNRAELSMGPQPG
jgi:hypothetical protein